MCLTWTDCSQIISQTAEYLSKEETQTTNLDLHIPLEKKKTTLATALCLRLSDQLFWMEEW